ncbi:MAG TPA: tyrosine-type recombinase/integrase [Clostridiales bacterium]|jgi:integrase/recombinase XerD|nr:tyrosine-type recombinase/integrase [Clostridiales bacterium]
MDRIQDFLDHLENTRGIAKNTRLAYARDLRQFLAYCKRKGVDRIEDISQTQVAAYLLQMKSDKIASATINRRLASLRLFGDYMVKQGLWQENSVIGIKAPRGERSPIIYLTVEEIEQLLQKPDASMKGRRDRALLELLYATGIRVSEAVDLDLTDLNLTIGYLMTGGVRQRIIPVGRPARQALTEYIETARDTFIKEKSENALFVNMDGKRLTRQGIWKIIRNYGADLPFADRLTPQILRNSFAVHLVQNGADLKTLKELMGQEDISATQIYMMVMRNRLKEVYDKAFPRA